MDTEKILAEFDEVFYEIMGLETDPEGTPNMLLIRDEDGDVLNSIDFTPEKESLKAFFISKLHQALAEDRERVRGIFDALPRKFWEDQDHAVGGYISKKDLKELLETLTTPKGE